MDQSQNENHTLSQIFNQGSRTPCEGGAGGMIVLLLHEGVIVKNLTARKNKWPWRASYPQPPILLGDSRYTFQLLLFWKIASSPRFPPSRILPRFPPLYYGRCQLSRANIYFSHVPGHDHAKIHENLTIARGQGCKEGGMGTRLAFQSEAFADCSVGMYAEFRRTSTASQQIDAASAENDI